MCEVGDGRITRLGGEYLSCRWNRNFHLIMTWRVTSSQDGIVICISKCLRMRTDIAPVVKKSKLADSVGLSKGLSREKGDRSRENLRKSLSPQLSPDPPENPVLHDCRVADQAPVDSVGSPVLLSLIHI